MIAKKDNAGLKEVPLDRPYLESVKGESSRSMRSESACQCLQRCLGDIGKETTIMADLMRSQNVLKPVKSI